MKNSVKIMLAAAALLSAFSCTKEMAETSVAGLVPMTFEAGFGTKTALDANGKTNLWVAGDKVNVFDGTATQVFTAKTAGASTTLEGSVTDGAAEFYALYPAQASATCTSGTITAALPSTQVATLGSYDPTAALAVAYSTNSTFAFKNVCSLVKVTISDDDIRSVMITGNEYETLAGTLNIAVGKDGTLSSSIADVYETKTVTLAAKDGATLAPGTYYIAVLPTTFNKGLTVSLVNTAGKIASKAGVAAVTAERSSVVNLGTVAPSFAASAATDLYSKYEAGEDILVAGHVVNKKLFGDATHVTADAAVDAEGVYFVDSEATLTLSNTSSTPFANLVVIGNNATTRSNVVIKTLLYFKTPATVLFANATVATTGLTNYPITPGTDCVINRLALDNVRWPGVSGKVLCYLGAAKKKMYSFRMANSEYCHVGNNTQLINNQSAVGYTMGDCYLYNNIFYTSGSSMTTASATVSGVGSTTANTGVYVGHAVFAKNTYVDVQSSSASSTMGLIYTKNLRSLDFHDNLFSFGSNLSKDGAFIRTTEYLSTYGVIKDNLVYRPEASTTTLRYAYYSNKKPTAASITDPIVKTDADPLTTRDKANCSFVQDPSYSTYGATR